MVRFVLLILAAILVTVFAVSNTESVAVTLLPLPYSIELPIYLLIMIPLALGYLGGTFLFSFRNWRLKSRIHKLEQKISDK